MNNNTHETDKQGTNEDKTDVLDDFSNLSEEEKEQLARHCLRKTFMTWTEIQDNENISYRKLTTIEQVSATTRAIKKIKKLQPKDRQTLDDLSEIEDVLGTAKERHYAGSNKILGASLVVGVLAGLFSRGNLALMLNFFLGPILYYFACMAPQFVIEKRRRTFGAMGDNIVERILGFLLSDKANVPLRKFNDGPITEEHHNKGSLKGLFLGTIFIVLASTFIWVFAAINGVRNYILYK